MLTLLERTLLGILSLGQASGYEVRRQLQLSPGLGFSASTGAVYPALRRLEAAGLISGEVRRGGSRPESRVFRLTEPGKDALLAWLTSPVAEAELARASDPLLTRMLFFDNLSPSQVAAFCRRQGALMAKHIARAEAFRDRYGKALGHYQRLCLENGLMHLRLQAEWVAKVAEEAEERAGGRSDPKG